MADQALNAGSWAVSPKEWCVTQVILSSSFGPFEDYSADTDVVSSGVAAAAVVYPL
jgi:hypothetical protein